MLCMSVFWTKTYRANVKSSLESNQRALTRNLKLVRQRKKNLTKFIGMEEEEEGKEERKKLKEDFADRADCILCSATTYMSHP